MFPRFCLEPPEAGKFRPCVFYSLRGSHGFSRAERPRNPNVSKILPLTTLRTIDLGGKKNSGPLFSRFCAKTECFFGGIYAPQSVHQITTDGAEALRAPSEVQSR
jgi:hypothetical protein